MKPISNVYDGEAFNFSAFQQDNSEWVHIMFHVQIKQNAWEPLCGIIEELGELESAYTIEDKLDAIGDVVVYMVDYCSCMDILLTDIAYDGCCVMTLQQLFVTVGKLSHSYLKLMQKIRMNEPHLNNIRDYLSHIIIHLRGTLQMLSQNTDKHYTLEKVTRDVWNKVKQRDWNKNKVDGGV